MRIWFPCSQSCMAGKIQSQISHPAFQCQDYGFLMLSVAGRHCVIGFSGVRFSLVKSWLSCIIQLRCITNIPMLLVQCLPHWRSSFIWVLCLCLPISQHASRLPLRHDFLAKSTGCVIWNMIKGQWWHLHFPLQPSQSQACLFTPQGQSQKRAEGLPWRNKLVAKKLIGNQIKSLLSSGSASKRTHKTLQIFLKSSFPLHAPGFPCTSTCARTDPNALSFLSSLQNPPSNLVREHLSSSFFPTLFFDLLFFSFSMSNPLRLQYKSH